MALTKVTGQVIKNTTDVTVGVLTVTNTLAVGGTVSIGGTLTYEDVTNVDAVGLITARNGIVVGSGITLSKDGDIFATGVTTTGSLVSSGAISGTTGSFTGDVDIADKIIHTGDTNTAIRFPAADTITAETGGSERFRINSNGDVTTTGEASFSRQNAGFTARSGDAVSVTRASGTPLEINRTGSDGQMISLFDDNTQEASISLDSGSLTFGLPNGSTERARITSNGTFQMNGGSIQIDGTGEFAVFESDTSLSFNNSAQISLDFSSNVARLRSTANGSGTNRPLALCIGSSEKIRIDTSGHMGLGVTPNANWPTNDDFKALQIGTGACVFGRGSGDDDRAGFAANYYATGSGNAYLANGHANLIYLNDGNIDFYTAAANSSGAGAALTLSQILRMNTSGNLKVGNNSDRDLGGLSNQRLHIEGTDGAGSAIGLVNNQNSTGQAAVYFSKSRGTSVGSNTILQDGDPMGSLVFCGSDGNDMISIGAQITAEVDGTPGSNDMPGRIVFKTTPDGAAVPTERFRITEEGNIAYKNQSVFQRKSGGFISLSSGVTHDIKICGDMGNNDLIRVCWAINWNAGDGGAWGEAVIWKQYEGTVRVRFVTDVKASPISSVSFPDSGDSVWLRMATNAGINGYYMIDVQTHGCTPHAF